MDSDTEPQAEPQAEPSRRLPKIQFRVLIIGRANAGKTSILQRVCETTESPVIRRGKEEVVCGATFLFTRLISLSTRLNWSRP
jgi:GTPase SAR1 family protein